MLLIRLHTFFRLTTWSSKKSQKFKLQCELENKSWFKSRTGNNCIIYENYNDRSRIAVPNDFHLQNTFEYLYFPWVDLSSCKVMGDLQTHWRVLQNLRILVTCKQHDVHFFFNEINFFIFFFFLTANVSIVSFLSLYKFLSPTHFFSFVQKIWIPKRKNSYGSTKKQSKSSKNSCKSFNGQKKTLFSFSKQIKSSKNSWKFFIRKI